MGRESFGDIGHFVLLAERGGRAKRYFALTAAGHRQLHASPAALLSMWANVAHKIRKVRS